MSTTPSPITPHSTLLSGSALTWITSHLAILILSISAVIGSIYFVESIEQRHEAKEAALYSSLTTAQAAQNQLLESQLKADETNWLAIQQQLIAQNSQLAQAVAQKNQQLAIQVKADATLDAQSAASKLVQQTGASPGDITAQENGININLPTARRIVSNLDTLTVVQDNLASTQKQLDNETIIASNSQTDVASQKQIVVGLQTEISTSTKACDARVAEANAKTRKAGIKGFLYGAGSALLAIAIHSI